MAFQQSACLESPSEGLKITGSGVTQKYLDLEGKRLSCDCDMDIVLEHFSSSVSYFSFSIYCPERSAASCHVIAVSVSPPRPPTVALAIFDFTLNTSCQAWMLNFIYFLEFNTEQKQPHSPYSYLFATVIFFTDSSDFMSGSPFSLILGTDT